MKSNQKAVRHLQVKPPAKVYGKTAGAANKRNASVAKKRTPPVSAAKRTPLTPKRTPKRTPLTPKRTPLTRRRTTATRVK